jgi:hypothetical protein
MMMMLEAESNLERVSLTVKLKPVMSAEEWLRELLELAGHVRKASEDLPEKWAAKLGMSREEVLQLYEVEVAGAMNPGYTISVHPRLTATGMARISLAASKLGMHVQQRYT